MTRPWPEHEIEQMCRLWKDDLTLEEMGVELGRSSQAVGMKLTKLRKAGVSGLQPRARGSRGRIHPTEPRVCMRCQVEFNSTHIGNRLCDACQHFASTA